MNWKTRTRCQLFRAVPMIFAFALCSNADPGLKQKEALLEADPAQPNPGQPFALGLLVEYGDTSLRPQLQISFDLGQQLAAAFQGVEIADPLGADLQASATLNGQILSVQITDDGSPSFPKYPMKRPILVVRFSGLQAGTYNFGPSTASATDLGGAALKLKFKLVSTSFAVSPGRILTEALPAGSTTQRYVETLRFSHLNGRVTWSLSSGNIPQGLAVGPSAAIGGVIAAGAAGTYQFTIRATGEDLAFAERQFTLQVTNAPSKLQDAIFGDTDNSQTVSPGDTITMRFDEALQVGPQSASAFVPSEASDSFGSFTVNSGSSPEFVVLTLGTGAILKKLSTKAGIAVNPVASGPTDVEGLPLAQIALKITESIPAPGRQSWTVGVAIPPLKLTASPFKDPQYKVTGLPAGVSYANGQITGAPTTPGFGTITVVGGDIVGELDYHWVIASQAAPTGFGLDGYEMVEMHAGSLLFLDVRTQDPVTPVTASINGIQLIALPGKLVSEPHFVLPDNAASGDLVVVQGGQSFNAGAVQVTALTNPTNDRPFVEKAHAWNPDGFAHGVAHVSGRDFGNNPVFFVQGIQVNPIAVGDSFATLPLPAEAAGCDVEEMEIRVVNPILPQPGFAQER